MSDNVLEVDMTTLQAVAGPIMDAGFPLLIQGRHGIGKSEFVKQLAKEKGLEVIEMRPSVMSEGDLTGLPFKGPAITTAAGTLVTSTEYSPPLWYLRACAVGVILFFDEADRGSMEVAQGLFQINDSRQLNGHVLHPDTRIVACVNGGRFGQLYQVREMDLAEFDRYAKFQLEPTVNEWLSWADGNILGEVVSFFRLKENQHFLENTKNDTPESGKIYPTRRSWTRLARTIEGCSSFEKGFNSENQILARQIAAGFVGIDAAAAFVNHANSFVRVVDPKTVFFQGRTDVLSSFTPMDHEDFMQRTLNEKIFSTGNLSKVKAETMREYLTSIPAEMIPTLLMKFTESNVNDISGLKSFWKMLSGATIGESFSNIFLGTKFDFESMTPKKEEEE
jgi:hypothetical protein